MCARACCVVAIVVLALIESGGPTLALTDSEVEQLIAVLHPNPQALARLEKQFPAFKRRRQAKPVASASSRQPGGPVLVDAAPGPVKAAPSSPNALPGSPTFLLRNDWADLGLLSACTPGGVAAASAKGASLSFTQDYVANNRIWAAQAMAAAVFSNCNEALVPTVNTGVFETSWAVYAQVNSSYNSNVKLASANNLDTRTVGGSGEIAYLTASGDYNIIRFTPSVVQDVIHDTTAPTGLLQYIPLFVSQPGFWSPTLLFGSIIYQFDPTLDLQYATTGTSKKTILFSGKEESLRLGPELNFIFTPFGSGTDPILRRIKFTETFDPWYEFYSSHTAYWWANSLTYNLTDAGNVSVGINYNRGLDLNSGTMTNQYVLSLNGKL